MLGRFVGSLYNAAADLNRRNILSLVPSAPSAKLLDLGCDDGVWTSKVATAIGTLHVSGVEIVTVRAEQARAKGVDVAIADLAGKIPLAAESFDVIHANQVVEHVPHVDHFMGEIHRLLKPRGIAVISTENASSWVNVLAVALGWQMFSLTNMSAKKAGIGNPLALHRGGGVELSSWTHKTIFSYRGLTEFCEAHGFRVLKVKGAGYFPLPAWLGLVDPRHAHFLTVSLQKL